MGLHLQLPALSLLTGAAAVPRESHFWPACGLGLREVGTPSGEKPGQETGRPVGTSLCHADPFVFPHLCALLPHLHVLDEAPWGRPRR